MIGDNRVSPQNWRLATTTGEADPQTIAGGRDKPEPYPQAQVVSGFRILRAIDDAASQGVDIPATDDSDHFLLSFYLKWVFNRNYGGQHSYRALSQIDFGYLVGWYEKFCGEEVSPPVQEVDAGGRIKVYALYARTCSPIGS